MIDINAIINEALNEAIAQAIRPLAERIVALEIKLTEANLFHKEINTVVDMDALRQLVKPMIDSVVENAFEDHCEEYDHDRYDDIANTVDDMPDFDNIDEAVKDAVRGLTFDLSVR
jgi:hypothetical protein